MSSPSQHEELQQVQDQVETTTVEVTRVVEGEKMASTSASSSFPPTSSEERGQQDGVNESEEAESQSSITTQVDPNVHIAAAAADALETETERSLNIESSPIVKSDQSRGQTKIAVGSLLAVFRRKKSSQTDESSESPQLSSSTSSNLTSTVEINRLSSLENIISRSLRQKGAEKKASVYQSLLEWDATRISSMNVHRNIMESLLSRIDIRMKQSQDNLTGFGTFIRQLAEAVACAVPKQTPSSNSFAIAASRQICSEIYADLYTAINEFETKRKTLSVIAEQFSTRIEREIFQAVLAPESEASLKTMTQIRYNLNNLKQSLLEQQRKVSEKSKKLREVFAMNQQLRPDSHAKRDFQKSLYAFLRVAEDLRDTQTVVAKATIGYWKKAIELEKVRALAISKSIAVVLALNEELLVKSSCSSRTTDEKDSCSLALVIPRSVVDSLKRQDFSDSYVTEKMGFQEIVSSEDQTYIAERTMKERATGNVKDASSIDQQKQESDDKDKGEQVREVLMSDVQTFLTKIEFPRFDDAGLPLACAKATRECSERKKQVESTILITPDAFLLCFDDNETRGEEDERRSSKESETAIYREKPSVSFAIQTVNVKKQGLSIEIKSTPSNSFMAFLRSPQELKLTFRAAEEMELFLQALTSVAEKN